MSVSLEVRGSPVFFPLSSPPPRPTNRIVSLGDTSAGQLEQASQSSDGSVSSMSLCFPPRWTPVSCACVGVSDEHSSSCLCSRAMPRSSSVRPRAQCNRKIMNDKARKCRHTSCQSVSSTDSVSKPDTPVNVIDFLHRDQRTVCVSSSECSDLVLRTNDFKCHKFRTPRFGKFNFQFRFSMQRFCSAVLCGLVLLIALRPQLSMAAPVSRTSSKDNGDASSDSEDQVLNQLKIQTDYALSLFNNNLRSQYCKQVLYQNSGCNDLEFDLKIGPFQFKKVPKKPGDVVDSNHFEGKEDELLQFFHHNFQFYVIALTKLYANQIPDESNLAREFQSLRQKIDTLKDELEQLMRLRGQEPPPKVLASDVADVGNTSDSATRAVHWGILVETINGVEYFNQLLSHLSPQQSTKL